MAEARRNSVAQWFPRTKISAEDVVPGHANFMRDGLSKAGDGAKKELHRIVDPKRSGNSTYDALSSDGCRSLIEVLNEMPIEQLSQYVQAESASLQSAKSNLDDKRTRGIRPAYVKTERFISEFDRLLTAYSGIVNIVASVDAQYGGIATATLAVLFTAATMKSKAEAAIVSAMGQISDRLPDFGTYQRIYPDPELGAMLSDAYRNVILLAREAISFFQRSNFRRHLRSMGKPAEFELMEQSMREDFRRVRLKCETLLAQRVDELGEELKNMQQHGDITLVAGLRDALNLGDYRYDDAKEELGKYREELEATFDKDRRRQKFDMRDFSAHDAYRYWSSRESVVLVLSGSNDSGVRGRELWLSPLAVDLTQDLLQDKRVVAFDICNDRSNCASTLARLIHQLLEINPKVVRAVEDRRDLQRYIEKQGDNGHLEGLKSALQRIVDLQKEPVYIILDRLDRLYWSEDDDPSGYINAMLTIVRETKGVLKVLIVVHSDIWDIEQNGHEIEHRKVEPELQTVRLDQQRRKH